MCGETSVRTVTSWTALYFVAVLLVARHRLSIQSSTEWCLLCIVASMYSLRTQEKLDAERNQNSSREVLWQHLNDKKKSGRMVRRIYNKTREEMAESCRTRCQEWVNKASTDMKSWVREPQPSVFKHTFRDRQPDAEIGPSNGHVSGRKYVPRLVFTGGGELDKDKTADLMEALREPSRMRGNDPNALQNPCRPTVIIADTAKIRGRVEHPHWEPPRYFLRPREKAREIGPDVQYADRNDMQRIFSAVVKNSLFSWGKYEERSADAAPTCRRENPEKRVGDRPFYPGFRFRDNQRESMSGDVFPPDLLNAGDYKRPRGFSRERHPSKELPQHERFKLVVKNDEYACPDGNTRRSLRFEEEPPEPYPTEKMYFASLRSVPVNPATQNLKAGGSNREYELLRKSRSLGALRGRLAAGGVKKEENTATGSDSVQGGEERSKARCESSVVLPLSASRSMTAVRFSGQARGWESGEEQEYQGAEVAEGEEGVGAAASRVGNAAIEREAGCDEKVAGKMRRGSEMASWATCGKSEKSARDYLW